MRDAVTVLYVEDDPDVLEMTRSLFELRFEKVHTAKDGAEGLEAYKRIRPDLIITDYNMPKMNGIEMAGAIKKIDEEVPIVLLTAFDTVTLMSDAINTGIDGYLSKPIRLDAMTTVFNRVVRYIDHKKQFLREAKLLREYKKAVDAGAIVSKTDIQGTITYVNDAFCTISGYTVDELIGARHNIVRDPEVPDAMFAQMWSTILRRQVWKGTFKNRAKDGTAYYVSATVVPIVDENNEIEEFLAIRQDVTELFEHRLRLEQRVQEEVAKNIEERRVHEEERLKEVKFSTIGRMAAGITHEINTPLTYIKGNLELMNADISGVADEELRGYLQQDIQTVLDGVNRIASIVESMREMASHSSEKMQIHNLYATLVTALTMAYNRSKQVCTITLQGEPFAIGLSKEAHRFDVCIQKQRIEQVWVIVVNNALDALKLIEPYEKRILDISVSEADGDVCVRFVDNGGGINETLLPRIFDAFESGKEEGGIGIGLNIAKKIVEEHGGTITASNVGSGAQFVISLPKECL